MQASTIEAACLDELSRLHLERNALELDVCGYTVVEDALDPDVTARGLEAALRTFGERMGRRPDVETGEGYDGYWVSRFMLLKDPAFEEIVMAEKVLALIDYLVGKDCILSTLTGHMRGQGGGGEPCRLGICRCMATTPRRSRIPRSTISPPSTSS